MSVQSKDITIITDGNLTIIKGSPMSGKNTMLAGIALRTEKEDNLVILTETSLYDSGVLLKVADHYSEVLTGSIDRMVEVMSKIPANNIFIEQYDPINLADFRQYEKDMLTLKDVAKILDKKIFIGVYKKLKGYL